MFSSQGMLGFNSRSWAAAICVAVLSGLVAVYATRPPHPPTTRGQAFVGGDRPGERSPDPLTADDIGYQIPRDRISAIDAPTFVRARDAGRVSDQMPVIGVALGGEAKAYPIPLLSRVEIVNDQIGGRAIAVTW